MSEENNSGYRVPLTKVKAVRNHPNAHSLSITTVYGFDVVTGLDTYQVGDLCIFIPIDSLMYNRTIVDLVFPPQGKMKFPSDKRIRQTRIRQFPSSGLLIKPSLLEPVFGENWWINIEPETDLGAMLEIIKYEPPGYKQNLNSQGKQERNRPMENPRFHQYGGLIHAKWVPDLFTSEDEVVVQCKIHGSNCRFGLLPTAVNTTWRKMLNLMRMLPKHEYVYGSNRVQLQQKNNFKGYYGEDVYAQAIKNCNGFDKIKEGETVFGELVCEGIQANYHYGHKTPHFILFDVKTTDAAGNQNFLNPDEVEAYAKERGFDFVPVLYRGKFDMSKIEPLVSGPSVYYPEHKVREGIVIKAAKGYANFGNKKALKLLNPDYLSQDNTDFK